jgi:hypothetical protein
MSEPTNDLDELLRMAARDYNRPGDVPRDAMWASIRATRGGRAPVVPRAAAWKRFMVPAVAAALLVIGVAIGRVYERMRIPTRGVPNVATTPSDSGHTTSNTVGESVRTVATVPETGGEATPAPQAAPRISHPASASPRSPTRGATNMAFRLAVVQHLAGTEAMLTSFRDEAARGNVDAQITSWARNLLTTTRLLQTAAAQQDPTMKRLLDDLELVLVQIAQYSSTGPHRAEELELIQHSIERRGVIGKLRTTIPVRLAPSGT